MNLICVPPDRAGEFWPLARQHVYAAMDRGGLRSAQDVEREVLAGRALLWVVVEAQRVCGAGVTELADGACWIVAWGADDHSRCAALLATVEDYARAEGCYAIRICGRKGWERMLPDYRLKAVVLGKELF